MTTSRLIGAAEIEEVLKQLPDRLARQVTGQALRAGGAIIVKHAKQKLASNGSIDTGALQKAVTVKSGQQGKAQVGIRRISMTVTRKGRSKPEKVSPARYAHLVEFGTKHSAAEPFLRPALDEGGEEAIRKIGEMMGRGAEREARALATGKKSTITGRKVR